MMPKTIQTFKLDCLVGHSMSIYVCADYECKSPHIVIYDEDRKPLVTMAVPEACLEVFRTWGDEVATAQVLKRQAGKPQ